MAATSLRAQQPAPIPTENGVYTLHENTHLVLLDVTVTDKQGHPVAGLKQQDFKVLEDGQPQTIKFFEEHAPVDPAEVAKERAAALAAQPNTFTNYEPFSGRPITVLMLNELFPLHVAPPRARAILQNMLDLIQQSPPDTPFVVYVLGPELRLVQAVTTDRTLLASKILGIDMRNLPQIGSEKPLDPATRTAMPVNDVIGARRAFMTGAVQQLTASLKDTPGRKVLYAFTGAFQCSVVLSTGAAGVPPCPAYGHVGHDREFLCGLEDTLEQSRIWIYRYYRPNAIGYGFGCGSTGANLRDLSHNYTLYYSPTNRDWNGKYRTTTVVSANKALRLAYRQGYYGTPENVEAHYYTQAPAPAPAKANSGEPTIVATPVAAETQSSESQTSDATKVSLSPANQILHRRQEQVPAKAPPDPESSVFSVQVIPADANPILTSAMSSGRKDQQKSQLLTLLFTIPAGESKVVQSDSGQYVARLEITAADYADGQSQGTYASQVVVSYDGATDPRISKSAITAKLTVEAPGIGRSRWLQVTVRDVATGQMGSLVIPMEQVKLPNTPEKLP